MLRVSSVSANRFLHFPVHSLPAGKYHSLAQNPTPKSPHLAYPCWHCSRGWLVHPACCQPVRFDPTVMERCSRWTDLSVAWLGWVRRTWWTSCPPEESWWSGFWRPRSAATEQFLSICDTSSPDTGQTGIVLSSNPSVSVSVQSNLASLRVQLQNVHDTLAPTVILCINYGGGTVSYVWVPDGGGWAVSSVCLSCQHSVAKLCWCAIKKLLTHSLTKLLAQWPTMWG